MKEACSLEVVLCADRPELNSLQWNTTSSASLKPQDFQYFRRKHTFNLIRTMRPNFRIVDISDLLFLACGQREWSLRSSYVVGGRDDRFRGCGNYFGGHGIGWMGCAIERLWDAWLSDALNGCVGWWARSIDGPDERL